MKFICINFLIVMLAGCATKIIKFDSTYLKTHGKANFRHSRLDCYKASKATISQMGGVVKKESSKNFKFYSNQFAVSTNPGALKGVPDSQKFYISVKGDSKECSIHFMKYKAWIKSKEVKKLPDEIMHEVVFNPFFNTILSNLENSSSKP